MRCREFLNNHVGYVDDLLPGVEMEAMDRHRGLCGNCARHDAAVRRSLLIVRNLPVIHPSADFMDRLHARIREGAILEDRRVSRAYVPAIGNFAALAAGLAAVGYIAVQVARTVLQPAASTAAAMTATVIPSATSLTFDSPALASVVSTQIPVWPDLLTSEDAPPRGAFSPIEQTSLNH